MDYWLSVALAEAAVIDAIRANADSILAATTIVLVAYVVPQLLHQAKVRACTVPLPTAVAVLTAVCTAAGVFATLRMWLTSGVEVLIALLWLVMIWQRIAYTRTE